MALGDIDLRLDPTVKNEIDNMRHCESSALAVVRNAGEDT
jgi:hypothetical protein